MKITPAKLNFFLLFKLPAAYLTGVRTTYLDSNQCKATVKFRWINQNPFHSMYWAVQGMAAELTTGVLLLTKIKESGRNISMLVAQNKGSFSKKATGKIIFTCNEGNLVDKVISETIKTGEGQTITMNSVGINSNGFEVSNFSFEWTIKLKT
jgi:hypothetical protein